MCGVCCMHTCVVPHTCAHRLAHLTNPGSSLRAEPCSRCWERRSEQKTKLLRTTHLQPTVSVHTGPSQHRCPHALVLVPRHFRPGTVPLTNPCAKQRLLASPLQPRTPEPRPCWELGSQPLSSPSQGLGWRSPSSDYEAGPRLTQGAVWSEGPRLSTSGLSTRVGGWRGHGRLPLASWKVPSPVLGFGPILWVLDARRIYFYLVPNKGVVR